jgi:hypothetical protein
MKLPPLDDCKLSVMLAEKLYCLADKSATALFTYLFLQHFPCKIRMFLSQDNPADMGAIAVKGDWLIALHVLWRMTLVSLSLLGGLIE